MSPQRIVVVILFAGLVASASYLSYYGVGGASIDAARSLRSYSVGGPGGFGRVK